MENSLHTTVSHFWAFDHLLRPFPLKVQGVNYCGLGFRASWSVHVPPGLQVPNTLFGLKPPLLNWILGPFGFFQSHAVYGVRSTNTIVIPFWPSLGKQWSTRTSGPPKVKWRTDSRKRPSESLLPGRGHCSRAKPIARVRCCRRHRPRRHKKAFQSTASRR